MQVQRGSASEKRLVLSEQIISHVRNKVFCQRCKIKYDFLNAKCSFKVYAEDSGDFLANYFN